MDTIKYELQNYEYDKKLRQDLTPSEDRVYRCLYSHRNVKTGNSTVWPLQTTIAKLAGLCVRTVQRAIKKLKALGYIIVGKQNKKAGNLNKYKLLVTWKNNKKNVENAQDNTNNSSLDDLDAFASSGYVGKNTTIKSTNNNYKGKILSCTKINKISKKQLKSIHEFSDSVILNVIGKSKYIQKASLFIERLVEEARKRGELMPFQQKKYKNLFPYDEI